MILLSTLVLLYAAQSDPFEAISQKAATALDQNRLDEAIGLYRQSLRLRPGWADGWWSLGTLFYDRERYAEGRDAFRRFTALNPKAGPAFAMLGLCEFKTKEYNSALTHLTRGFELGLPPGDPLTNSSITHQILLLNQSQNYERAMLLLTVLARQGDTSPDLIAAAGLAGLRRPMLPSSIAPEDRELVFKMGRALMTAADRHAVEARPMFEEIVSAYPKTPNLHYTYGAFLLTNEPDLAVGEFQKELEIQPRHLPTLVSLAMEYLKRGEPAKARPVAELAARIAPDNFTARAALGRTLLDMEETEKGMRELEVAVKLAPESPQVHLSLASAYAKLGRKAEAARERSEFARLKKQVDAEQGR